MRNRMNEAIYISGQSCILIDPQIIFDQSQRILEAIKETREYSRGQFIARELAKHNAKASKWYHPFMKCVTFDEVQKRLEAEADGPCWTDYGEISQNYIVLEKTAKRMLHLAKLALENGVTEMYVTANDWDNMNLNDSWE